MYSQESLVSYQVEPIISSDDIRYHHTFGTCLLWEAPMSSPPGTTASSSHCCCHWTAWPCLEPASSARYCPICQALQPDKHLVHCANVLEPLRSQRYSAFSGILSMSKPPCIPSPSGVTLCWLPAKGVSQPSIETGSDVVSHRRVSQRYIWTPAMDIAWLWATNHPPSQQIAWRSSLSSLQSCFLPSHLPPALPSALLSHPPVVELLLRGHQRPSNS